MYPRKTIAATVLVLGCAGVLNQPAAQTPWQPTRAIHLIVGNPPGGATDVIGRTLAQPLSARLGQNIVIDNRPGANGNISAEVVAKSPPNGHAILYANNSLAVINPHIYSTMAVQPIRDLIPVVTTISNQLVLAINPKVVPVDDFPGFIEFAKKASTPLFYASIGNGSQHHLAMELLKMSAGVDLTHIPYKGGGPASIAVIAGENHVMFGGTSAVQHIKSGKLKGIAVTGKRGWQTMPELPGIGEFYPGYMINLWHGIFAPRGTPQPVLDRLRTEINAVLAMPQVRDTLISTGAGEPFITTPAEFEALLRSDYESYGKVIKSIGLKVD
jgi:tripartite-type tricarboxylate transporter receptor subunit TctC